MAGVRQTRSKASHRREVQTREHRIQQRITLGAIVVLALVVAVVAAGVLITEVLPPRGEVLRVGDQSYNARALSQRAEFVLSGGDQSVAANPVDGPIESLIREETLLQAGAPLVGEITGDDLKKEIREGLGLAEDATDEAYVQAYQAFLRETPISQELYERSLRAKIIDERLSAKFAAELPAAGLQVKLQGGGGPDRAKVQELRAAVVAGADFATKAVEIGLLPAAASSEIGWILPDRLGQIKDTVMALQPGEVTEVIPVQNGAAHVLYRMSERDENREYDEAQKTQLAQAKVDEWITQQRESLNVTQDVSDAERSWITRQVRDAARDAAAANAGGIAPVRGN